MRRLEEDSNPAKLVSVLMMKTSSDSRCLICVVRTLMMVDNNNQEPVRTCLGWSVTREPRHNVFLSFIYAVPLSTPSPPFQTH